MTASGVETELKIPVSDLATVRSRLEGRGARLKYANAREVNVLLDTDDRRLSDSGCVLRLRSYRDLRIITFKGPVSYNGPLKVRPEHEARVEDLEKVRDVFEALGYHAVARYEKDRETWSAGETEVVLDHTPMGDFVEIEGPSELLDSVARSLDLDPDDAVRGSYTSLWADFRTRHPERNLPHDMVFEG